jgi:hypothetical protein
VKAYYGSSVDCADDLATSEREAARIGGAYDTLRNLVREVALQQVHAIDKLSRTLADLDRDSGAGGADGELSLRDVHSLGIAADFSKDDLEDIISATLRIDSSRATPQTRTAAYARRIFAELEHQLQRDLSNPTILQAVREEFLKLLDERVRMELLVLQAATTPRVDPASDSSRLSRSQGRSASAVPCKSPLRPAAPSSSRPAETSVASASFSLFSRTAAPHAAPSSRAGREQESLRSLAARARQARDVYDRSRSVSPAPVSARRGREEQFQEEDDTTISSLSSASRS